MRLALHLGAFSLVCAAITGCGGADTYCQSGPKYGTQCYYAPAPPGPPPNGNPPPEAKPSLFK